MPTHPGIVARVASRATGNATAEGARDNGVAVRYTCGP